MEGQTSNTYQIASVDASINGAAFYCFVQNVAGNTQSSVCTVTVLSKPVLTQDVSTTSQTLTEGDTIALTAGATGAAGIQWYYKKGDEAPKPVDGATTASLSVAATMEYNGADIYCQFVNDAGAVTTSFCRITVNAKPAAPVTTKNPTGETVHRGRPRDLHRPRRRTRQATSGASSAPTARRSMTIPPRAPRSRR